MKQIADHLATLADPGYRSFQAKLVPTVDPTRIMGVRVPRLRAYAKEIARTPQLRSRFLTELPHASYDEDMLHALLIAQLKEPRGDTTGAVWAQAVDEVQAFLPFVDNWAVCDGLAPKLFAAHTGELRCLVDGWLADPATYTRRFALDMMLQFLLGEAFRPVDLERVAALPAGDYYVDMAAAWYLSYALVERYEQTVPLLEERRLDPWVHAKTIQKAIESFRISDEHKAYLRTLRQSALVKGTPVSPRCGGSS